MATKDLLKKINGLEEKIDRLEMKEKELEKNLADEKLYSDPNLLKEMTSDYNQVKTELENTIEKWQYLSEELVKIESQFS